MDAYKINDLSKFLSENAYPGRGIVVGKTEDGKYAVAAYFIMGRSANSRNRIFVEKDSAVFTKAFDESKVVDPSLIIYPAIKRINNHLIVTNGDQTDTIYQGILSGKSFFESVNTRTFEPDAPNYTPRISAFLTFNEGDFSYKMSILRSVDEKGSACQKSGFSFPSVSGLGHFIHTYQCDGNPIPPFYGEPERVKIANNIDEFSEGVWNNLNFENKISLYVRFIDLKSGEIQNRLINKNN